MYGMRRIWMTRHGESEYNVRGLIGGDSSLSPAGEEYAQRLPQVILDRLPIGDDGLHAPLTVWTSTLRRTIATARCLPFPILRWKALDEINAGLCDGMTYADIRELRPEDFKGRLNDKLRYRYPCGESYLDVIHRLEPVIMEIEQQCDSVCIVAHQAVIRALYGYFMGIDQEDIPNIPVPLHTLIELTPLPDGTMHEQHIHVPLSCETLSLAHAHSADPMPQQPHRQHLMVTA